MLIFTEKNTKSLHPEYTKLPQTIKDLTYSLVLISDIRQKIIDLAAINDFSDDWNLESLAMKKNNLPKSELINTWDELCSQPVSTTILEEHYVNEQIKVYVMEELLKAAKLIIY